MNTVLEFTEAVAIVIFASAAECITAGCAGSETFLFATHLLATRARLQTGAISTPPERIIIAMNITAVSLLATNTARHDLTPLAGFNGQLVQVFVVRVARCTVGNVTHTAYDHGLLRLGLETVQAGSKLVFVAGGAHKEVINVELLLARATVQYASIRMLWEIIIVTDTVAVQGVTMGAAGIHAHFADIRSAKPALHGLLALWARERIASYVTAEILAVRLMKTEESLFVALPALLARVPFSISDENHRQRTYSRTRKSPPAERWEALDNAHNGLEIDIGPLLFVIGSVTASSKAQICRTQHGRPTERL